MVSRLVKVLERCLLYVGFWTLVQKDILIMSRYSFWVLNCHFYCIECVDCFIIQAIYQKFKLYCGVVCFENRGREFWPVTLKPRYNIRISKDPGIWILIYSIWYSIGLRVWWSPGEEPDTVIIDPNIEMSTQIRNQWWHNEWLKEFRNFYHSFSRAWCTICFSLTN